mgnify:CR=1 FL=1
MNKTLEQRLSILENEIGMNLIKESKQIIYVDTYGDDFEEFVVIPFLKWCGLNYEEIEPEDYLDFMEESNVPPPKGYSEDSQFVNVPKFCKLYLKWLIRNKFVEKSYLTKPLPILKLPALKGKPEFKAEKERLKQEHESDLVLLEQVKKTLIWKRLEKRGWDIYKPSTTDRYFGVRIESIPKFWGAIKYNSSTSHFYYPEKGDTKIPVDFTKNKDTLAGIIKCLKFMKDSIS